jgi:hypothetical protein
MCLGYAGCMMNVDTGVTHKLWPYGIYNSSACPTARLRLFSSNFLVRGTALRCVEAGVLLRKCLVHVLHAISSSMTCVRSRQQLVLCRYPMHMLLPPMYVMMMM